MALSASPAGFTASQWASRVRALSHHGETAYGGRRSAYDLKKLRGKPAIRRVGKTRRYAPMPQGLKTIALVALRNQAIKPLLACRPATPGAAPGSESAVVGQALRGASRRNAGRLSRTRNSRVNIDNYFVGLCP